MPDLPTVDESGVAGFENVTWHSIVVVKDIGYQPSNRVGPQAAA
jgi:tripartite-type tricarboxylate transporter receptor subunit TctC